MNKKIQSKELHEIKIGVLGGGQLGRMLSLSTSNLGIQLHFLDKSTKYPAGQVTSNFQVGDFTSYDDVLNFGKDKDIITIEIENVNTDALKELQSNGKKVYPQPELIELIKDKGLQKQFYKEQELPSSEFKLYENQNEISSDLENGSIQYPFVQKLRKEGYDGKGVSIIHSADQLKNLFKKPSLIENLVNIEKELAIVVARNEAGQIKSYPTVEMVFDDKANLVDYLLCPANVNASIDNKCQTIASELIQKLDLIGLLAVEFFLTKEGHILINEIAPRTHNSGHFSMDACVTSQFEQHLRSVTNMPLGSTKLISPAMMINIIGPLGYTGKAQYPWLSEIMKYANTHVHIYGKEESRPSRKLGHINILADNHKSLLAKGAEIKGIIEEYNTY